METEQIAPDLLDNTQLLSVLDAMKNGDFSARMPLDRTGIAGKIADTVNEMIDRHERLTGELKRVSTVVGKEGKTAQRAALDGARGAWKDSLESFNDLIVDLVQPTTEVARVIGAVANGDLSQTMSLEIDGRPLTGEFFKTANTINIMSRTGSRPMSPASPVCSKASAICSRSRASSSPSWRPSSPCSMACSTSWKISRRGVPY